MALNGSGVATYTTSALTTATHAMSAVYAGDSNYVTSTGTLSQVVNVSPATKVAFTTTASGITAGSASALMTVQLQDSSNTPVNAVASTDVNLVSTSTTGKFDTAAGGSFGGSITKVVIAAGSNSASFYYKDTKSGTPTITASSANLTNATQQQTVVPAAIDHYTVSTISSPQIINTNFSVTISGKDAYDNDTLNSETINITLGKTDAGATPTSASLTGGTATISNMRLTVAQTAQTIIFTGATSGKTGTSAAFDVVSPPTVTTVSSSILGTTSVELVGSLTNSGNIPNLAASFEYWTGSSGHLTSAILPVTPTGGFGTQIDGLTADTLYSFKAKAVSGSTTFSGNEMTFRTPAVAITFSGMGKVPPNYDFDIQVNLSQVTNLKTALFDVMFDSAVLQYSSETWGQIGTTNISGNSVASSTAITGGRRFIINMTNSVSGSGALAIIHFRSAGTTNQSTTLSFANNQITNGSAQIIEAAWVNSGVGVTVAAGDANGDLVINVLDLTKVARIILQLDSATAGADANLDGVVNVLDMTKIARIILQLDPF